MPPEFNRHKVQIATSVAKGKKVVLEKLRLQLRGEDPDQFRPNDMISMGTVEEYINDEIAELDQELKSIEANAKKGAPRNVLLDP